MPRGAPMTERSKPPIQGTERGKAREVREILPYAVMDIEQLAECLGVSKRQAERQNFPCYYLGTRTRRFLGQDVLDHLRKKAA